MANVKIPYALVPAVAVEKRRDNVLSAIARGYPRLTRTLKDESKTLYVACYGPSLRETWQQLRGKSPIIAMSGATKFLAERGVIADYAIEMDPRVSQVAVSLPPVTGVTYLVASCVCPEYFDQLREAGNRVILWHTVNTNWEDEMNFIAQHDPHQLVVHAGSTVGLATIHVGGILGFKRFEIHGMDGSFADGARHAGIHGGKAQKDSHTWAAGGKTYRTSQIMANAVAETINTAKNFPIITVWHGDGLTQALIREANLMNAACADETEKVAKLSGMTTRVVQTPIFKGRSFWDSLLQHLSPSDLPDLVTRIPLCESRRVKAKYNTGTIPFESAAYLRALTRFYPVDVAVEIGTFIGTSTHAINAKRVVYTCDQSNDCVPSTYESEPNILTHPYQSSTQMLTQIQEPVDLFFFDGRVQKDDLPHIRRLMKPTTVFVVDDYVQGEKGVANVERLAPHLTNHMLFTPDPGPSTLAVIAPSVPR
jgi:predicted O-methyltransferase YrrM